MTLISKLLDRFRFFGYRHAYVEGFLDSYIATQIKVLREQRQLTQVRLAELSGMHQSQIAALEDIHHSSWKIGTLKRLARAFDLALIVRFESFGKVLPDLDRFGRSMLERPSFDEDRVFGPSMMIEATASTHNGGSPIEVEGESVESMAAGTVVRTSACFSGEMSQRAA